MPIALVSISMDSPCCVHYDIAAVAAIKRDRQYHKLIVVKYLDRQQVWVLSPLLWTQWGHYQLYEKSGALLTTLKTSHT